MLNIRNIIALTALFGSFGCQAESEESQSARAYALSIENQALQAAMDRFDISDDDKSVVAFLRTEHPELFSGSATPAASPELQARVSALEAVLNGMEPKVAYEKFGLGNVGLTEDAWALDMRNLSSEYVQGFQDVAQMQQSEMISLLLSNEALVSEYVERSLGRAICAQPDIRARIDGKIEQEVAMHGQTAAPGEDVVWAWCVAESRTWFEEFATSLSATDRGSQWRKYLRSFSTNRD
ncbi:MAG: hypothetical protein AB8G16_05615 [Gammaproteobacteria bacterium]